VPSEYVTSHGPKPVRLIATSTGPEPQTVPPPEIAAEGALLIDTLNVCTSEGHDPAAAIVFVTTYDPGVLATRSIAPVDAFIESPEVELKTPAVPLVNTGEGLDWFEQKLPEA
jgi:hypothetical protein